MSYEKPVNAAQIKLFGIKPPSPKPPSPKPVMPTYHDACMEGREINLEEHGYKLSPVSMPTPVRFFSLKTEKSDDVSKMSEEAASDGLPKRDISEVSVNSQGKEIRRPLSLPAIEEVDEIKFSHAELRM